MIKIQTLTERPQLTISALERGLGMVDDFIDHFVKFKHETDAVMALYREVYQDMQKQAEQLRVTSSQSLLPLPLLCILDHSITLITSSQNASDIPLNMITIVLMFISG